MRAVLMSLKPRWWEKMLSGEKAAEVRKTAPVALLGGAEVLCDPFHVFVYISGTGEVRGHFLCPGWERTKDMRGLSGPSCVPAADLHRYAGAKDEVVAWSVRNPMALPFPMPLSVFGAKRPPMSWQYIDVSENTLQFAMTGCTAPQQVDDFLATSLLKEQIEQFPPGAMSKELQSLCRGGPHHTACEINQRFEDFLADSAVPVGKE